MLTIRGRVECTRRERSVQNESCVTVRFLSLLLPRNHSRVVIENTPNALKYFYCFASYFLVGRKNQLLSVCVSVCEAAVITSE